MKNIHFITTSDKNCYLYNFNLERLFLIPPVLYGILAENNTFNCSDEEKEYYTKKIQYFKKYRLLDNRILRPDFLDISPQMVQNSFINTNQITFEVTDKCNIACKYCAYRELYNDYDERKGVNLDINSAIKLLSTLSIYWKSNKNTSSNKIVDIGFYGGEPTLNMKFVENIVHYVKEIKDINRTFTFSMTTNGMLLDKYMDYLVINKFRILISLDGNDKNNMNRLDKNGNSTFERVIYNLDLLKAKYPDYFDEYVSFNAVLHDKNPIEDLYFFFKSKYGKRPRLSPLGTSGRNADKKSIFKLMDRNIQKELEDSKHGNEIVKWMGISAPGYLAFVNFVYQIMGSVYTNYNELIRGKKTTKFLPTGTCLPFSRKIYITVNDKILPCERVGQNLVLGYIQDNVNIDFSKIASIYNGYYEKIRMKCTTCYRYKSCMICLLAENGECNMQMKEGLFKKWLRYNIEKVEKRPQSYKEIKYKIIIK